MSELIAVYGENKPITDGNYDKELAVTCVNGTFVGRRQDGVIEYRGIPFVGEQPVGQNRWKAPVDYVADDGVYEAYHNAKSPCQLNPVLTSQGEDCLYLNVWKADVASTEKKPVMVWIHGGAFAMGSIAEPWYDCHNLAAENPDVVFASISYRVGVFGFTHLSHLPDGADYPDAQNLGLMDQLMALKWIHENIQAFGGDPDNVTIFGESAGAASVCLLPLVKGTHGYFKRIIAESGSPVFTRSPEEAIACTDELMEVLGCRCVADLQAVSVDDLLKATAAVLQLRIWAERDGAFLPLDPYGEYARGAVADIDVLQGCNKDEMGLFINSFGLEGYNAFAEDRYARKMAQLTEEERALAEGFCKDAQDVTETYTSVSRLFDQIVFIAPLFRVSENQTEAGGRSYTYFFTPESANPLIRCGHGAETPSVFGIPEDIGVTGRAYDETFSRILRDMWVQFAKTGNPSLSAEVSPDGCAKEWPLYDTKDRYVMIFDEFDIHPEREAERGILDWDRTYSLTTYYCI